jgi:hypothetical protein
MMWLINNELERIWKEVVIAKFKVLLWHLPVWTEENLSQDSQSLDPDLNPGPPKYKAGMLTT